MTGIYDEIAAERRRAHAKHGPTGRSCEQLDWYSNLWLPILTEEVGEVAKAICDDEPLEQLRAELIQVAAMAAAWAEAIPHTPTPAVTVTDAEVEAASNALPNFGHPNGYVTSEMLREVLEAAAAARAAQEGIGENPPCCCDDMTGDGNCMYCRAAQEDDR